MNRPACEEYDPFYATYVDKVPAGEILDLLHAGGQETLALLRSCPPERETFRYAEGKWSIRELVGHVRVHRR